METILAKYMRRIHESAADTGAYVFRGQSDARWPLRSGASRRLAVESAKEGDQEYVEDYLEYHRDLLDRARRIAPYGYRGPSETDLQLLAKLQHFGAATGLLDFTYSPLVALWFASDGPSRDGNVFFLSHEPPNTTFVTPEQEAQDIKEFLSTTQDAAGPSYLLWEPVVDGDAALRILGQRSVFVIGRPVVDEQRVNAVRIDAVDKEPLRAELLQVDVSERTIFRDLVGFCQQERATAQRTEPKTAAAFLRRANGAFVRGEYGDAVELYGRSLEFGEASETRFLRGNANAAWGRHGEAVEDYGKALVAPDLAKEDGGSMHHPWFLFAIYFNRGNEQACQGRHVEAIGDYVRAADIVPSFISTHFNCGNAHFMEQHYVEAVACYDQALALDGRYAPAMVNKALALVLQGDLEAAEASYRKAAAVKPLPAQTLDSLEVVKSALAGLTDMPLSVEVVSVGDQLEATVRMPDYAGPKPVRFAVGFMGITGNVGNVGAPGLGGGDGFEGGAGVTFIVRLG